MALTITPSLLDQINRVMSDRAALRALPIDDVLQLLIEAGFASARYYDVAHDISSGEQALFLSHYRYAIPIPLTPLGLKIPFSATSLGRNIQGNKPVVECLAGDDIPTAYQEWVNALNLHGMPWADVPVRIGEVLVGVLALSWSGNRSVLSTADECSLSNIAAVVAGHIEHVAENKIEYFFNRLSEHESADSDISMLLDTCASMALNAVDGKLASIFEYDWATNRLLKIIDKSHPPIPQSSYEETYDAGSYLTGRAFKDVTYRHIVDLPALINDNRRLVHNESLRCHEKLVGSVKSLLYGLIAETDRRYLLRIVNRVDADALPFVATHHRVFTRLCSKFSGLVEYTIVRRRLRRLSRAAHATISNISNLPGSVLAVEEALQNEQIPEVCILVHGPDSQHFSFMHFTNRALREALSSSYIPWEGRGFYGEAMRLQECAVLELDRFAECHESGHLVERLFTAGVRQVLIVPIEAATHRGVMIAPIPDMKKGALKRMPGSIQELLQAYTAMLGSAIKASDSYLTTENARRLIGQIGHEIESPISALGQNAIAAVLAARQVAGLTDEGREELEKYEKVVTNSMRDTSVSLWT